MLKKPLQFAATLSLGMLLAASSALANKPKPTTTAKPLMDDDSKTFVMKAAQGNVMEIEAAKTAEKMATNKSVKDFAKMMATDHTKSGEELKTVALKKAMGVPIPSELDKDQREDLEDLKESKDFDRKFMTMMIDAHQDMIDLFENYSKIGKDAELKAFTDKMLPKLRDHLKKAKDVEAGLDQMTQR